MAAVTEVAVDGVAGFTTYRLHVNIPASAANVYVIAGTPDSPLHMPAAYQCALPFGKHLGGVSPLMFAVANSDAYGFAEFDSWLTIGPDDGSYEFSSSPGVNDLLAGWSETQELEIPDGAVFWMPTDVDRAPGPGPSSVLLAQLTVVTGTAFTARAKLQGRSVGEGADDWTESNVYWVVGSGETDPSGTGPSPSPPPAVCVWDATFTFEACCATASFDVEGQTCVYGDMTYTNCCTVEEPPPPPSPPVWWCADDPGFVDGAGYSCAEWATGEYSCTDDTGGYDPGDRSALWAACPAACGRCQSENWQGVAECWSGDVDYSSCCTGDADGDGVPGYSACWTETHTFDTCMCNEPVCDANQHMPRPWGSGSFVLSATTCGFAHPAVAPRGRCVWDALWGNGYCDAYAGSLSYNPDPNGPWWSAWQADLNCEQAGFGKCCLGVPDDSSLDRLPDITLCGSDGGDCRTGADDPCPEPGWVPICPGTSCPDDAPETECAGSCYKVPDYGDTWEEHFGRGVQSRLGNGESNRHSAVNAKAPLIDTLWCRRNMRRVPQLRGTQMGPRRLCDRCQLLL